MSGPQPGAKVALEEAVAAFGLSGGGAIEALAGRLGALAETARSAPRRAAILIAVAWGGPLFLALADGAAFGPAESRPYLRDLGVWARFVVAIAILVAMDTLVDAKLRGYLRHLADAPLIAPSSMPAAAAAVVRCIDRARGAGPALVCAALAVAIGAASAANILLRDEPSWLLDIGAGGAAISAAGWWAACVSGPIFWFLLLRWLWRHLAWALLLRDLSRLELRLVATHPDGAGGLAFLGGYPNVFAALVLAMSCVVAAAVARALTAEDLTAEAFGWLMTAWLAIVMALFAAPIITFGAPLRRLKEETLLAAAALATRHFRAAERESLGRNIAAPGDDAAQEPLADPSKLFAAARKLATVPFSRSALAPLGAAALLPLLAAGATRLPFAELWKVARRLLLL